MTDETVKIENIPIDIEILLQIIEGLGAKVDRINKNTIKINASNIHTVKQIPIVSEKSEVLIIW